MPCAGTASGKDLDIPVPSLTGLPSSASPFLQLLSTTQTQHLSGHVQLKQGGVHPNRLGNTGRQGQMNPRGCRHQVMLPGPGWCWICREDRGKLPAQQDTTQLCLLHNSPSWISLETFSLLFSLPEPRREELAVTRLLTHSPSPALLGAWGCFLSNK